jgi:hypothetical protein
MDGGILPKTQANHLIINKKTQIAMELHKDGKKEILGLD